MLADATRRVSWFLLFNTYRGTLASRPWARMRLVLASHIRSFGKHGGIRRIFQVHLPILCKAFSSRCAHLSLRLNWLHSFSGSSSTLLHSISNRTFKRIWCPSFIFAGVCLLDLRDWTSAILMDHCEWKVTVVSIPRRSFILCRVALLAGPALWAEWIWIAWNSCGGCGSCHCYHWAS